MLTATPAPSALAASPGWRAKLRRASQRPVSADSVAAVRIIFGLLVVYSSVRFIAKGWVDQLWLQPEYHLTYSRFEWVRPLPGNWMYLVPLAVAASGLAMAFGWHHRRATVVFLVGFTWTELIDAALYLNHYWFMTLVGLLMLTLPVHHHWSLDARARRVPLNGTVTAWIVWVLRAQVGVVYIFAGVAKLNPDWLVRAQPLRLWLADRSDLAVVGGLLDTDFVAYLASWGAATFDLTVVGWLLWRRSRLSAWAALVFFHLVTGALFQIGVFPVVMGAMALIFFEPDWPRTMLRLPTRPSRAATSPPPVHVSKVGVFFLIALAAIQVMLPLRHFAADGNVRWNEDGYYLAWRVMLTEKAGHVDYQVSNAATGHTWQASPQLVLTDWQASHAATRPDLIHQTARLLESKLLSDDPELDLQIRADVWVSMNGRPAARLLDPELDLLAYDRGDLPADAVLAYG